LDFATVSDPHVRAALWSAGAALAVTLVLLAAILAIRVRYLSRLDSERNAAALWIPLIARCTDSVAANLPPLRRRDADHFVLLWCRAQDSLRGASQEHLREMARRLGADVHARRMFRSRSVRRRLVGTVALGHLHALDLAPSLQEKIESGPALPSLVAAKALVRVRLESCGSATLTAKVSRARPASTEYRPGCLRTAKTVSLTRVSATGALSGPVTRCTVPVNVTSPGRTDAGGVAPGAVAKKLGRASHSTAFPSSTGKPGADVRFDS